MNQKTGPTSQYSGEVGQNNQRMPLHSGKPCTVEFQPLGRRIEVPAGTTLVQTARQAGLPLASDCGGRGTCGRCRVEILSGSVSTPDPAEQGVLARKNALPKERLACRLQLLGDAKIHIPAASRAYEQVLQLEGRLRPSQGDRLVTSMQLALAPPTLHDQRSNLKRLMETMQLPGITEWNASPQFVRRLSEITPSSDGRLTVFLRDGMPAGLASEAATPLGIAIDIGTTTIAGRLVDLASGAEICSAGIMNPQISIGEDVISRLDYAIHHPEGDRELACMLREALDGLIKTLCETGQASPDRITDVAVCGNTAISHLLLQLPAGPLARAPYIAGFSSPLEISAENMGLHHAPYARVLIMPCIEGFVGGDHVAMILACSLDGSSDTVLGVDIGTNTEIVLARPGSPGELFVTSCASGPALEGAHIRDGMRAAAGAIEQVRITADGPVVTTINDEPAAGICGSGLVDALSELLRIGTLDTRGHLKKTAAHVKAGPDGPFYRLVTDGAADGRDIRITQRDISEIQLAKGAIYAGIQTLLEKTDTPAEEVRCVYLAGAFGSHLNIASALSIALLPDLPNARYIQAGNAAADGTTLVLMSKKERERAAAIALRAQHVELANDSGFSRSLVRAMQFKAKTDEPAPGDIASVLEKF